MIQKDVNFLNACVHARVTLVKIASPYRPNLTSSKYARKMRQHIPECAAQCACMFIDRTPITLTPWRHTNASVNLCKTERVPANSFGARQICSVVGGTYVSWLMISALHRDTVNYEQILATSVGFRVSELNVCPSVCEVVGDAGMSRFQILPVK